MADLKHFVWDGLKSGSHCDLYLNSWPKIGSGEANIVESLHLKMTGHVSFLGIKAEGDVEIIMPDAHSEGVCTVILNGAKSDNCRYMVKGGKLVINHPKAQILMWDHDKKWTWVHVNHPVSAKIGIWPSKHDMAVEDTFGDV